MLWYRIILAGALGYLIGAIPVGYFVIYAMKGQDLRRQGSGRTGGTNAIRAGGSWAGVLTGAGDILKGFLAIMAARWIGVGSPWAEVAAGIAAVVGHNWSIYLGFKGGAGTGPNIGVCVALWPLSALWLIPLLPFGLNVIRYASVTSLLIAVVIPLTLAVHAALGLGPWIHLVYALGAALAVTWSLRPNIKRLQNGTEPRSPRLFAR
ncbi:MAG: Glycerol-3-phosphate acyltransferase [Chloroflexi bacterium ADurb.Bin325]|nr:MAG: Glycerol-3-phosphate acyltransferase [Chloroflexi bacterium ADurb.Bin325]